jgi:hypothetical protein
VCAPGQLTDGGPTTGPLSLASPPDTRGVPPVALAGLVLGLAAAALGDPQVLQRGVSGGCRPRPDRASAEFDRERRRQVGGVVIAGAADGPGRAGSLLDLP